MVAQYFPLNLGAFGSEIRTDHLITQRESVSNMDSVAHRVYTEISTLITSLKSHFGYNKIFRLLLGTDAHNPCY